MTARADRTSLLCYRLLLRAYPRGFRARFQHDLEVDFERLIATHGFRAAWLRTLVGLVARRAPHL